MTLLEIQSFILLTCFTTTFNILGFFPFLKGIGCRPEAKVVCALNGSIHTFKFAASRVGSFQLKCYELFYHALKLFIGEGRISRLRAVLLCNV